MELAQGQRQPGEAISANGGQMLSGEDEACFKSRLQQVQLWEVQSTSRSSRRCIRADEESGMAQATDSGNGRNESHLPTLEFLACDARYDDIDSALPWLRLPLVKKEQRYDWAVS
jgi:hypothetical protein